MPVDPSFAFKISQNLSTKQLHNKKKSTLSDCNDSIKHIFISEVPFVKLVCRYVVKYHLLDL